jgi:hypothetical protein
MRWCVASLCGVGSSLMPMSAHEARGMSFPTATMGFQVKLDIYKHIVWTAERGVRDCSLGHERDTTVWVEECPVVRSQDPTSAICSCIRYSLRLLDVTNYLKRRSRRWVSLSNHQHSFSHDMSQAHSQLTASSRVCGPTINSQCTEEMRLSLTLRSFNCRPSIYDLFGLRSFCS